RVKLEHPLLRLRRQSYATPEERPTRLAGLGTVPESVRLVGKWGQSPILVTSRNRGQSPPSPAEPPAHLHEEHVVGLDAPHVAEVPAEFEHARPPQILARLRPHDEERGPGVE